VIYGFLALIIEKLPKTSKNQDSQDFSQNSGSSQIRFFLKESP
jgi:hypothetical protein